MTKPQNFEEYAATVAPEHRDKIRELRAILKEVAPEAAEVVKWGYPMFEQKRILFAYAAFKGHMNFMPTKASLDPFMDELNDYLLGSGTMQLPYDKPLPKALIQKIARHRFIDVRDNDAHWAK